MRTQIIKWEGKDCWKNFVIWTNEVNILEGEITRIEICYHKKKEEKNFDK